MNSYQIVTRHGVRWCVALRHDGSLVSINRDGRLMWSLRSTKPFGPVLSEIAFQAQKQHAMEAK